MIKRLILEDDGHAVVYRLDQPVDRPIDLGHALRPLAQHRVREEANGMYGHGSLITVSRPDAILA